jgi:hypothetical protein
MISARTWLHIAAVVAPCAAAMLGSILLNRTDLRLATGQAVIFGIGGTLAAQIAALLRWHALDRRAREGSGAWKTGLGMAVTTHALFGLLFVAATAASMRWLEAGDPGSAKELFAQAGFIAALSVLSVGAITFPATALLAQKIAALRRKELADGAA